MSEEIDRIRYQLYKHGIHGVNDMSDEHVIELFNDELDDAPYWFCKDCHQFHSKGQAHCSSPYVGISETDAHVGTELVIHNTDKCIAKTRTEEEYETIYGEYDPGDYAQDDDHLQFQHTRLNKWLREAERVWQKKTGQKTLDIHNSAESPQRSHKMTQLEKDIFTLEINAFRTSRGEYRTGRKIFMDEKPLSISHFTEDEFGDRLITDEDGNIHQYKVRTDEIECGKVFCSGFYAMAPQKFEQLEAQVSACV